ncbi:metallophosphoesterase [Marinobacter halodurans]|uniref:Metallophosphoesterase n=1 Tax=Marinobacter halodurans TaxID=2528979 RepID=A0ABY1ZK44_9GAMM|nr:metallophosphoesterase [Marinobacter halodurans]TBW52536.1 metallophosphoesterase [Marinobacter halodurans]
MTRAAPEPKHPDELLEYRLSLRLGPVHARQRLGIEREFESRLVDRHGHFCHVEKWYSLHGLIRTCLRISGMLERAQNNARRMRTIDNRFVIPHLPESFEGYRILQLTDLHVDMDEAMLDAIIEHVANLEYDLCVLTGDYRKLTWGPIDASLDGMHRLRQVLKGTPLGVLGNHDSIRMLPALEDMGYRMLLNESMTLERGGARLHLSGVDDAHFYKVHNLQRAAEDIPPGEVSLLLSHTPEIWREAAHAGYDLFLCGHTHGGQICLPGGIPVLLDANCPRSLGKGAWRHGDMQGYTSCGAGTSMVHARLNCPPEVNMHTLTRGPA